MSSHKSSETLQNHFVVVPKAYRGVRDVGDAEEAELVNAWYAAGEEAAVRVIVLLTVVHNIEEAQGFL